jgi:2-polyprenyl-6-methoxyphenol hydroxylase-like FAD-dependent oxidoreductase
MVLGMTNRRVLISGAGVAGPALAFWLQRHGLTPTVIERAPEPRDGGYAVDFRGASLRVLDRMGLLAQVEAAATRMGEVTYVDGDDRPLVGTPASFQSGELEILRGDLSRILYDATKDDVEYVFGDSITGVLDRDDGVTVTFEHGEPREFDLVIGADGLHSTVRSLVFGDESWYRRDLGYHVSICTVPNHLGLDHAGRFYNEPNRTIGVYSARDNTEAKALFWFGAGSLDYDHRDVEQQRRRLGDVDAARGDARGAGLLLRLGQPDRARQLLTRPRRAGRRRRVLRVAALGHGDEPRDRRRVRAGRRAGGRGR